MVAPALRVLEETRTRIVTPVIGPNGEQVAVATFDFAPLGFLSNELELAPDLRPFIVNCDDGIALCFNTKDGRNHQIYRLSENCKRGDILGDIYFDAPRADVLLYELFCA